MSIKRTAQNLTALPDALLADAKLHMRVDWSYDDAFIKSVIARAIGRFEQLNEVALNVATFEWTPAITEFCDTRARVPVTPVSAFIVKDGSAVDISSSFAITTNSVFGVPILYMSGAPVVGMVVTLTAGFATLPPPVLDVVMRNTAHLYEHREILIPSGVGGGDFVAPDLKIDATWWMPRV